MSLRIALENNQEFFTNLDVIKGRIILGLNRQEQISAIIVKLEGESKTALCIPSGFSDTQAPGGPPGNIVHEDHKILYVVQQVFPEQDVALSAITPAALLPGHHEFPFSFRIPINNICSDPEAMAKAAGLIGHGGFANGPALFGIRGIRTVGGSKQLMYPHVIKTLPPSFTGFPRQAEIRYYLKVTIQRPSLFKENWRHEVGLKFLPIEPPRPGRTNQEAFARRPFTFRPPHPPSQPPGRLKPPGSVLTSRRSTSFLSTSGPASQSQTPSLSSPSSPLNNDGQAPESLATAADSAAASSSELEPTAPSVEIDVRLPYPNILTCNKPVPLRITAKKLAAVPDPVHLVFIQIELVGTTHVRCQDLHNTEATRWVVVSRSELQIPVCEAAAAVGTVTTIPDTLWNAAPLPNTVMPSFVTCNLRREYRLEIQIGLSWTKPTPQQSGWRPSSWTQSRGKSIPQRIQLPLHFAKVSVYSGLTPSREFIEAALRRMRHQDSPNSNSPNSNNTISSPPVSPPLASFHSPPRPFQPAIIIPLSHHPRPHHPFHLAPRPSTSTATPVPVTPARITDPLYPPQLAPGQLPYDDAPPSYDEAVAASVSGPAVPNGANRPAYSGITNENEPSSIPASGDGKR